MGPTLAIILVFVGCCSNVVFLELLVKEDPGVGNLITFSQFLFIAIEGFIFTSKLVYIDLVFIKLSKLIKKKYPLYVNLRTLIYF